jgi:TPR repeat protein
MKLKKRYIIIGIPLGAIVLVFAYMLAIGIATPPDPYYLTNKKIKAYTIKAENGDIIACWRLHLHYQGIDKNDKAEYWLRKAATYGDPKAQADMAYFLQRIKDPQSHQEAIDWLNKADKINYAFAQKELGKIYYEGKITDKDIKQAEYWYRKAALNGDEVAMDTLSKLLIENYHDRRSYIEAYKWSGLALSRVDPQSALAIWSREKQSLVLKNIKQLGIDEKAFIVEAEVEKTKIEKQIPIIPKEPVTDPYRE